MPDSGGAPARIAERITSALALAGGALMLAVSFMIVTSVLLRWAGGSGVSGDFELVQMATALIVFACYPICQARRSNIMVDTFTARWPKRLRDGIDGVWSLLYAGFALLIAVQVGRGALETVSNRTTTMVLGLPTGYAIGIAALISLWLAYVCLDVAIRQLAGRWPER